ncbi:nascent polypeptide-associated complex subunit alpha, muscle-specific form-like [Penaeus vannamei]|uniref:nascent polypeptide-associated complex subunit alpha, muscle-specific form-like n=1 Tax=Penaeus vannamei TaxID=6689 RepID=UPI00387F9529
MCDATLPSPTSPSTSFPLPSFSPVLSDLSRADNRLLDTLVPYNSTVKYDFTSLSTNTEFYSSYSHRNLTDTHCPDPRVSDTSDLFKDVFYLNNPLRLPCIACLCTISVLLVPYVVLLIVILLPFRCYTSATTGHSITGKAATPPAPASDKVTTGPPDASATTGHSITGKAATPLAPASDKVTTGPPDASATTGHSITGKAATPPAPANDKVTTGPPDASATTGHSITGKAATPPAPASDKVTTGPPDASATTGHSITGKAATPPAPASDKVTTGPPDASATTATPSGSTQPKVTPTPSYKNLTPSTAASERTSLGNHSHVWDCWRPTYGCIVQGRGRLLIRTPVHISRLVVSLTPEDELPSAPPHVSETIGVSRSVVSLKPEDGLPSVPSRVTVICYDSAVDIRVKPEDGLPSEILRASEVAVLDLPTPTRATSVTHALGLPTPAAPVASHTLSIVLPSVETEIVLLHRLTPSSYDNSLCLHRHILSPSASPTSDTLWHPSTFHKTVYKAGSPASDRETATTPLYRLNLCPSSVPAS